MAAWRTPCEVQTSRNCLVVSNRKLMGCQVGDAAATLPLKRNFFSRPIVVLVFVVPHVCFGAISGNLLEGTATYKLILFLGFTLIHFRLNILYSFLCDPQNICLRGYYSAFMRVLITRSRNHV